MIIADAKLANTKETVARRIIERHNMAAAIIQEKINTTEELNNTIDITRTKNDDVLDKLFEDLNNL